MGVKIKLVALELIAGLLGWVWIIASLAGTYFFVLVIFFEGIWSDLFWTIGIGIVAKWLARGFEANRKRVASEAIQAPTNVSYATTEPSSEAIIRKFAGYIEDNPFADDQILDVNLLPFSKATIFDAFITEFASPNPKFKRLDLTVIFFALPHFQEEVGDKPLYILGNNILETDMDFSNMSPAEKSSKIQRMAKTISENPQEELYNQLWPKVKKELEEYAVLLR